MTGTEFVGRVAERRLLDDRLAAALDGAGQVVLVAGEPGVGKTRLAAELRAEAGIPCLWARAIEEEGSPPHWLFRQLLAKDAWPDETDRFQLFEAVTDLFLKKAERHGLLVVLDDIQWADPASIHLLVHLARSMASARLLVVATFRHTETGDDLRAGLAALAGEEPVTRLRLSGLSEPEVAAQLAGVTGWPVPESVAAAICRRTQGNPFFVGELGRFLTLSGGGDELPERVRDAIRGRLRRLSPACQAVVASAAVLATEIDATSLAEATATPIVDVVEAIDEASSAGIVAGTRFAHDLIRESARLDVPTVRRLTLHQRMADYLRGRDDADARVAQISFHLLESLPAGDPGLAIEWTERAADAAMAQLAWEEAASLYGRALAVGGLPPRRRAELLLAQAKAQVRSYDVVGARQSVCAAADIGHAEANADILAEASLSMEGVTDFAWADTGRQLCEDALAAQPAGDSALRVRLMAQRLVNDSWRSLADAESQSAAALEMAERVGDRRALAEALRARQFACSGPDRVTERLALGDRMLALEDDDCLLWGRLWRFDAYAQLGRLDEAEAELPLIAEIAERLRSPLRRWHAVRCHAAMAHARGRLAEARMLGLEAESLARRAGHDGAVFPSQGFLLGLRTQTGDASIFPDDVIEKYAKTVAIVSMRALEAVWTLAAGNREKAHRIYKTLPVPGDSPPFVRLVSLTGMAELAVEFDDRETAAEVHRLLLPHADLFSCSGAGMVAILGSVRLYLGMTSVTCGRYDDAIRELRKTVEIHDRVGMPLYLALSTYWLAVALSRRKRAGDREEAAALAATAAAQAERIGMAPLFARARALVGTLGGRRSGPLSRRQYEIAGLVAQGLMNREIAAVLQLSERTVETHVNHILTRLDFANRTQIAAWVAAERMRTESP
ncbi:ATP-binding protein [Fodinicola acaciae]|uniref:ATP-binding protein n=1 Tax=Fodinicola acaciae TaxID=2681555 RepID=UPI0013D7AC97|nr:LuxR family transcriptional regulator [Fodinicola acaciae]